MSDPHNVVFIPATRERLTLLHVERAVAELRRGRYVVVLDGTGEASLVLAAEAATEEALQALADAAKSPSRLAITARRASVLRVVERAGGVVALATHEPLTAESVRNLADPLSQMATPPPFDVHPSVAEPHSGDSAAVKLAKTARLLPAAVVAPIHDDSAADPAAWAARHNVLMVDAGDVFQYESIAARSLKAVSRARVPLADALDTEIVAFRPRDGGLEHLAVLVGAPDPSGPTLTRLHSECFTGDLLGSLRCDCGDQLRGAIREIAKAGGGILLYLAQEGRGIGLVNKLRAYQLQDDGFDTLDANEQLGFDADERIYLPAAVILRQLGATQVRLLTNNPDKVDGLTRCGITVVERVPHTIPSNRHNEVYMRTKVERGGHLF